MELVTLAYIILNRIGSASGIGMSSHKQIDRVVEVSDDNPETLRAAVVKLATKYGERPGSLGEIHIETPSNGGHHPHMTTFNIQMLNVQYSTDYATCEVVPALKIGDRYFKLEEVACDSPIRVRVQPDDIPGGHC